MGKPESWEAGAALVCSRKLVCSKSGELRTLRGNLRLYAAAPETSGSSAHHLPKLYQSLCCPLPKVFKDTGLGCGRAQTLFCLLCLCHGPCRMKH